MELRYQENSPLEPYLFLMKMFRTRKYKHPLYELIKLHLWGYVDGNKVYHSINLLQDDDFVYFKLNMENPDEFEYIFGMSLEHILRYIPSELKVKFLKDTLPVEKSMLLWKSQTADSV